jgi:Rieske Fe-S protein
MAEQEHKRVERTPDEQAAEERRLHGRRQFLKWMIRAGYITFAVAFALPALALKSLTQERQPVAAGDVLVYSADIAGGASAGQPVMTADLQEGQAAQAFPQGKADNPDNLVQLVRIGAGDTTEAIVAFSAICTHLGCTVLRDLTGDGLIACPCHASQFDPRQDAAVVGGPAGRPLPSLPITINADGTIAAAGPFEGPIGPS